MISELILFLAAGFFCPIVASVHGLDWTAVVCSGSIINTNIRQTLSLKLTFIPIYVTKQIIDLLYHRYLNYLYKIKIRNIVYDFWPFPKITEIYSPPPPPRLL